MRQGGCLCGAVRYEVEGEPRVVVHCHCRMCQKSAGAAFITWATFPVSALRYTRGAPCSHRSSERALRAFCGACGTQLAFRVDGENVLDVTVASFDRPDDLVPVANIWTSSRRAFLHGFDERLENVEGDWPD